MGMAKIKGKIRMPPGGVKGPQGSISYEFDSSSPFPGMAKKAKKKPAKKKAPRKDASQTALSIVERVTGGKLK